MKSGMTYTLGDMRDDYKFTIYGGVVDLVVVSNNCPGIDIKAEVKAIGYYKIKNQYYYAVQMDMNEFTLIKKEHFKII